MGLFSRFNVKAVDQAYKDFMALQFVSLLAVRALDICEYGATVNIAAICDRTARVIGQSLIENANGGLELGAAAQRLDIVSSSIKRDLISKFGREHPGDEIGKELHSRFEAIAPRILKAAKKGYLKFSVMDAVNQVELYEGMIAQALYRALERGDNYGAELEREIEEESVRASYSEEDFLSEVDSRLKDAGFEQPDHDQQSPKEFVEQLHKNIEDINEQWIKKQQKYLLSFLQVSLKNAQVDMEALNTFNKFGVNLFMAGACETLRKKHNLDANTMSLLLTKPVTYMGFKKSDAEVFADKIQDYLLADTKYLQAYNAGQSIMISHLAEDPSAMNYLKLVLEEWNKPKETIEATPQAIDSSEMSKELNHSAVLARREQRQAAGKKVREEEQLKEQEQKAEKKWQDSEAWKKRWEKEENEPAIDEANSTPSRTVSIRSCSNCNQPLYIRMGYELNVCCPTCWHKWAHDGTTKEVRTNFTYPSSEPKAALENVPAGYARCPECAQVMNIDQREMKISCPTCDYLWERDRRID
jgi:hypothetical protein